MPVAAVGVVYILYLLAVHWWSGLLLDKTLHPSSITEPHAANPPVLPQASATKTKGKGVGAGMQSSSSRPGSSSSGPGVRDILVLYVFAYTDPEYLNNLKYFIREAVMEDERSMYYIAVQMVNDLHVGLSINLEMGVWVCLVVHGLT